MPEHFQSISESVSIRNSNEPLGKRNCRRGQTELLNYSWPTIVFIFFGTTCNVLSIKG